MPTKLKTIVTRALSIREKAGFTTETITRKRYKMAYIPDAIKQAAKELKSVEKPKRTTRVVKTKGITKKAAVVVAPVKRTKRIVNTKGLVKRKAKYGIDTLKAIEKKIRSLQNSWAYTFSIGYTDYSFSVTKDIITMHKTQRSGIYYTSKKVVEIDNDIVQQYIQKNIHLIETGVATKKI